MILQQYFCSTIKKWVIKFTVAGEVQEVVCKDLSKAYELVREITINKAVELLGDEVEPDFKTKVVWFVRCLFGKGSIDDGSICWFSEYFFCVHDYPADMGGDGQFSNVLQRCSKCHKNFVI